MHDIGIPAAFLAGLVSFLSPCVLPLVPGYVSLISGVGIEELKAQETALLRKVMLNSIAFVLGFSIVFVTLGALSTEVGQLAVQYKSTLSRVAGVLVIVFGLHLTGILRIKALYADKRLHNVKGGNTPWGAFVIGFAFAFGWTPCVGPILSGILVIAAAQNSVSKGILLLIVYSLGLAVPFLLTAVGIERFMKFYGGFRRHMHVVEVASGVLLIALGGLLIFGKFTVLSRYFSFLNRFVL
ncbi:MAG TPA: cytochrome c biogenesis protein CcdA [Terriglobales bacterium]|jgi:cytochrome c-type biogenesis protein|nr:cytochrome c biogenesis protein CcdA [Terriglobales bacterium]